jgi:hypothetical protein
MIMLVDFWRKWQWQVLYWAIIFWLAMSALDSALDALDILDWLP